MEKDLFLFFFSPLAWEKKSALEKTIFKCLKNFVLFPVIHFILK